MSLNWVEIDQVLREASLEGAFLQAVRQSDWHNFLLEFYSPGRPRTLLVSLTPGKTRLHEIQSRPRTLAKAPRFAEYLRAHLVGSRVTKAAQAGRERIVELSFETAEGPRSLWIRLWGGAANLLVSDPEGTILEAAFRRPAAGEVKGGRFSLPAPQVPSSSEKTYALRDFATLPGLTGQEPYSRLLELFYSTGGGEDTERLRSQALKLAEQRLNGLYASREKVRQKLSDYRRAEDWKTYGDLLVSHAWNLEKGAPFFEGEDWRDGSLIRLDLDPKLGPHENAQVYYKKYQKARDGLEAAEAELHSLDAEEQTWKSRLSGLETADAGALKEFLARHRTVKAVQKAKQEGRPGLEFHVGGFTVWVGRNARENDELLRRWVRGSDLWMHTRDVPGGFVFIRAVKGKTVPLEVLLDAGNLAVLYSKAKAQGRADLYYTNVKFLRRAKNGPLGLVLPTQEKNLTITLERSRIDRIHRTLEETS